MNGRSIADAVIEVPIVTSFTRFGYEARRRLAGWTPLDGYDLTGRVIVITGATSGLGYAAAEQLARCGARLVVVGRTAERNERAVAELTASTGNRSITHVAADMGDYDQVRALAGRVLADHDRLDVLIHNAGALDPEHRVAPDGTEQYARAKRAQVTLNEMWAERYGDRGITFHALHPGWADTPGVDAGLPTFAKVMGPYLRTPDQGADTLVWLAADDTPLASNGRFWLDRVARPVHKLPTTKRTDIVERRAQLWNRIAETAGTGKVHT